MEKKKTQAERVLDYIKKYGSITTLDAFRDLGVTRLSARIYELKHYNGLDINKKYVTSKNRHGEICTYAKYTLREN
ncbi:helix-turn-helix domain-containing protein [uncultured Thomasclavelia sp.]|uniref:helix-turn-helix domain-containing protein n=1 Tax=uncultured Thomasclavelia sp. TaxID=3025759 RepID=UPI0025993E1F|nr:helix-turn-helix domain-containing protein [uncultured Thomasclavelia sp.]